MQQIKTQAITLMRTNFGEADRIVNFLTPSGKMSGLARGARRQNSKLAGGLEVFSLNEVVFIKSKGDLKTIISARGKKFFSNIIKDLDRTEFGYYAIKKISSVSEHIDNFEFYDLLVKTFDSLDNLSIDLVLIRYWFDLNLAFATGDEINLEIDDKGNLLKPDQKYSFNIIDKVFEEDNDGEFSANHIKLLRLMISSEPQIISKIIGVNAIVQDVSKIIYAIAGK